MADVLSSIRGIKGVYILTGRLSETEEKLGSIHFYIIADDRLIYAMK